MTSYSVLKTSVLGDLLLVANATQLIGVYFSGSAHAPVEFGEWRREMNHAVLKETGAQIQDYLAGIRTSFSLPLHQAGTDFQMRVWREIALIPFGQTITYTELAGRVGASKATRAAGTATGRNPLSLIVPCHRVVGKQGSLGGYAGGLPRKQRLLKLEQNADFHLTIGNVKPNIAPRPGSLRANILPP